MLERARCGECAEIGGEGRTGIHAGQHGRAVTKAIIAFAIGASPAAVYTATISSPPVEEEYTPEVFARQNLRHEKWWDPGG